MSSWYTLSVKQTNVDLAWPGYVSSLPKKIVWPELYYLGPQAGQKDQLQWNLLSFKVLIFFFLFKRKKGIWEQKQVTLQNYFYKKAHKTNIIYHLAILYEMSLTPGVLQIDWKVMYMSAGDLHSPEEKQGEGSSRSCPNIWNCSESREKKKGGTSSGMAKIEVFWLGKDWKYIVGALYISLWDLSLQCLLATILS